MVSSHKKDIFMWGMKLPKGLKIVEKFKFRENKFMIQIESDRLENSFLFLDVRQRFVRHHYLEKILGELTTSAGVGVMTYGTSDLVIGFSDRHLIIYRVFWSPFAISPMDLITLESLGIKNHTKVEYLGYKPGESLFFCKFYFPTEGKVRLITLKVSHIGFKAVKVG